MTQVTLPPSMLETPIAPSRVRPAPKWPWTKVPRKTMKRKESTTSHNNQSRCSPGSDMPGKPQRIASPPASYAFDGVSLPPTGRRRPHRKTGRPVEERHLKYRLESPESAFATNSIIQQANPTSPPWQSTLTSYTLDSEPIPQFFNESNTPPLNGLHIHIANNMGGSWTEIPASCATIEPNLNANPAMDLPFGRYGSVSGSTPTTPDMDGYGFQMMTSSFEHPPVPAPMCEMEFSNQYFLPEHRYYSPSYQSSALYHDAFLSEINEMQVPVGVNFPTGFDASETYRTTFGRRSTYDIPRDPTFSFLSEGLPGSQPHQPQSRPDSEIVPFEAITYNQSAATNGYFESLQTKTRLLCRETPSTPPVDSDNESWVVPFDSKNFTPQHSSPSSLRSAVSSPRHLDPENHGGHVFGSFSGAAKPKVSKGRTRGLTQLEKKQAREVRNAKACWACHISKVKCSPCSPGSPCEQCARLINKRRFCKFECFNDPLESLYVFLVPDYLHGHFTRQDVEAFVSRNTKSWGKKRFHVRMSWGYRKRIEADVVALELQSETSEMAFHQTTQRSDSAQRTLVQQHSLPLGIPLDAMDHLEENYSKYVRSIAQNDLSLYYGRAAYFRQDSMLAKRVLKVVCDFYTSSLKAGSEFEILREAIEVHITSVILEKSLTLDNESENVIPAHLRRPHSGQAVARCAQRQIKLALFLSQQKRIHGILKNWGAMMWKISTTANNDNSWAVSYCVFLTLTLVIDKISAASHFICEDNIRYHGAEPASERAKLLELIKLTEVQLFDRCKEIFHWKFKTRKGGKEACNPIRDGLEAFRGRPVSDALANLTYGLQGAAREFDKEIRSHSTLSREQMTHLGFSPHTDLGRLACILLDDSLDH